MMVGDCIRGCTCGFFLADIVSKRGGHQQLANSLTNSCRGHHPNFQTDRVDVWKRRCPAKTKSQKRSRKLLPQFVTTTNGTRFAYSSTLVSEDSCTATDSYLSQPLAVTFCLFFFPEGILAVALPTLHVELWQKLKSLRHLDVLHFSALARISWNNRSTNFGRITSTQKYKL